MNPLTINIEINLGVETRKTLEDLGAYLAAGAIALGGKKEDFISFIKKTESEKEPGTESEPEKEPQKEPDQNPEPEEDPIDDLPEDLIEPAPDREVSDEELIGKVAEVKKTVPAKTIRELFNTFGISCSTACPQEKRVALLGALDNLKAENHA